MVTGPPWGVKDDNHLNEEDDSGGALKPRTRFGGRSKFSSYPLSSLLLLVEDLRKESKLFRAIAGDT